MVADADGRLVYVNAQAGALFGYSREALEGQRVETLIPGRLRDGHAGHRAHYAAAPRVRAMGNDSELLGCRSDGSEFPVAVSLSPVETANGSLVAASIRDISDTLAAHNELETLNRRLVDVNAAMEEFVYVASHDLKAPLQGIDHLVEWIAEDLGDAPAESIARNLERIAQRTSRLRALIDDLLTYSRVTRGQHPVEDVCPGEMIEAIAEVLDLRPRFELEVHNGDFRFDSVRTPLEAVLRNLISNAVKHHDREHGRIVVEVEARRADVRFTVTDDGPGIAEAHRERVFKLFQTLSGEQGGSGIGLTIVRRLVEKYGGQISVDKAPERGCRITFTWPRNLSTRDKQ